MKLESKIVIACLVIIFTISVGMFTYFLGSLNPISGKYLITDFHNEMIKIHFIILLGLITCSIGFFLRTFLGKVTTIGSIFLILSIYVWWYFEKFTYIRRAYGVDENSDKYNDVLNQLGLFRGANEWDVFVLMFILILFVWVLFRYEYKEALQ
jgi:hypothetical protein